jgi:EAL domain-containing protein (putative c-di-GMP-specific phosphodiesterase class I)/GAF domain-containing protein
MTAAGEPIRPDELFRWARDTGEAGALDRFVVERILTEAAAHQRSDQLLFLNVLPLSLPAVSDWLLQQSEVPPRRVVLELVEETSAGPDLIRWIGRLRREGYRLAVDDVGAGYSSLTRLVDVRPDFAKIDLALVRHIDDDPVKFSLVEATARFAHRTGIQLIAEGVESSGELATLRDLGIELAQGYLLGRPEWEPRSAPGIQLPVWVSQKDPPPEVLVSSLVRMLRLASRGLGNGEGAAEALVTLAAQISGAEMVALFQRAESPDGVQWTWLASQGLERRQDFPPEDLAIGEALFRQSRPLVLQTVDGRPGWRAGSLVALPITVRAKPWGALVVAYRAPDRVRPPTIEAITGLGALASMLADRNLDAASAAKVSGEGLALAAQALLSGRDDGEAPRPLEESLRHVLTAALSLTGAHAGFIGHIDGRGTLQCVDPEGEAFSMHLESFMNPESDDGRSLNGEALRLGSVAVSDDIRGDDRMRPWREELVSDGILSAAAVPLRMQGRIVGLLKVYHSAVGALADPDRRSRLDGLAALATAIIAHTERGNRAERAEQRLTAVLRGQRAMAEAEALEGVVQVLVDTVRDLTDASLAAVCRPSADHGFEVLAAAGDAEAYVDRWRPSDDAADFEGEHPVSVAYRTGETTFGRLRTDPGAEHRAGSHPSDWSTFGVRWVLAAPLRARGSPLMVLVVYGRTNDLEPDLRRILEHVARTAALALTAAQPRAADSPRGA